MQVFVTTSRKELRLNCWPYKNINGEKEQPSSFLKTNQIFKLLQNYPTIEQVEIADGSCRADVKSKVQGVRSLMHPTIPQYRSIINQLQNFRNYLKRILNNHQ